MSRERERPTTPHWLRCAWLCAVLAVASPAAARGAHQAALQGVQQRALDVNRLAAQMTNAGWFATDLAFWNGGLEFPRGTGKHVGFAGGLWVSGRASGSLRTAITEYGTDFVPGPSMPGGPGLDTLRYAVYSISRGDTTGWGAWMARGVPLGAPVDSLGTHPGLIGDQTMWAVYSDASTISQRYPNGPRTPIGLEMQMTAYAFDRAPVLQDVVFLHFRIIHKGSDILDSTYVGLWYDADMRSAHISAGSDSSLDLGYVYRLSDDNLYGVAGPATGVALLRGPRDAGAGQALRASSIVAYNNGNDPNSAEQYDGTLHGLYPWGVAMLDSTTSTNTLFYAWGDPATGTGWLMPNVVDPKVVVSAGPFHFAPGDTQIVDAAVVVGQGTDRPSSVVAMRNNLGEARAAFASGFASVPPRRPIPPGLLSAWPNPSNGAVQFNVRVPAGGARVELDILDLSGRRVRRVMDDWRPSGSSSASWDGTMESGRTAPAGLYFARSRVAGAISRTRIAL